MKTSYIMILSSLLFILNVGCSQPKDVIKNSKKPQWSDKIERFANCQALSEYLNSYIQENYNDGIPADVLPMHSSSSQHYQNQVNEVLEGDIVQSSEDYFYFVRASSIEVIQKSNLSLVKSIPIDELYPTHYLIYKQKKLYYIGSNYTETQIKAFDERNNFSAIFEQKYDGSMLDYRWIENNLVVVTHKYLSPYNLPSDCSNIYQSNWQNGSTEVTYIHKVNFNNSPILSRSSGVLGYTNIFYMTKDELLLFGNGNSSYFRKISWQGDSPELLQVEQFDGYLKDRFSIYKKDDYLFLAVSKWQWDSQRRSNHLLVFKEENNPDRPSYQYMNQSEAFGWDADIRSVLYHDHYAYVVTFEKTDPLFIIDIHNPMEIKIVSELESPGFSSQLKALSPNLLAGLGFNTQSDLQGFSWQAGLKLSLFNVKNELQPSEIQTLFWGERGSFSEATSEPKAFYVSQNKSLIMFPAVIMKYDQPPGFIPSRDLPTQLDFAGALILQMYDDGLREMGRLTHADWREKSCGQNAIREINGWSISNISGDIQRVFEYDGDYLSFSRFGVKRANSIDLTTQQELEFASHFSQCESLNNIIPKD